jgi:hypothetical protein
MQVSADTYANTKKDKSHQTLALFNSALLDRLAENISSLLRS